MKKFIVLLGLLAFAGGVCSAQTKGFTLGVWTQTSASFKGMSFYGNRNAFSTIDVAIAPGWNFNKSLFVRLQLDGTYGLWYNGGDNNRTWRENLSLGPTIGYNIIKDTSRWGILDINATVANSLMNKDWSYLYYDFGVNWSIPFWDTGRENRSRVLLGIGVRYYDSHNTRFDNSLNLSLKIGFRFN